MDIGHREMMGNSESDWREWKSTDNGDGSHDHPVEWNQSDEITKKDK